ncbi:hypothetical protein A2Y85_06340 [candidate division WOR-3 bacterium RBG_13_43_14]|uniref:Uncharacterized protein n=1 Tax=candidate division WOR-3 bacterium RBG_13_43_14 TaxID=1802590 RepID=A0A1F4UD02_UNCW3|nr:MAG: hypothetical protein A2Y85_06340 [candidate division WOR-3 bacterium RBG_13_43_14]
MWNQFNARPETREPGKLKHTLLILHRKVLRDSYYESKLDCACDHSPRIITYPPPAAINILQTAIYLFHVSTSTQIIPNNTLLSIGEITDVNSKVKVYRGKDKIRLDLG